MSNHMHTLPAEAPYDLVKQIIFQIRRLIQAQALHTKELNKKYQVSASQLNCLLALYENGPLPPSQIARHIMVNSSTVTGIIDRLEHKGLVRRMRTSQDRRVITIESEKASFRAITGNLDEAVPGGYQSMLGRFEQTAAAVKDRWDVAIVDPPRAGLGVDGVDAVARTAPRTIVLISCDPASLARDAGLLTTSGYRLDWVQPVDLFPQTYHIETVARFELR